ncbi:hypothetical protein ANCDUO_18249, partial [Ancylostoma duodenale]
TGPGYFCSDQHEIPSSPAILLSLPVIALSLLTLTTTMQPEQRFTTSASFAVLALKFVYGQLS